VRRILATANLVLRFLLEMAGVIALGIAGLAVAEDGPIRLVAAVGLPLGFILIWAFVVAPNAANGLSQPQKDGIGTILLVLAAVALGVAGQPWLAIALGVLVLVNAAGLFVFGEEARTAFGRMAR
jgi:hypothetical protein